MPFTGTTTMTTYPAPGDFTWMKNKADAHMMTDMWNAVTAANAWDFVRGDDVPNKISAIMSHSKVGHSGASMAFVLRTIQAITRDGWDAFVFRSGGISAEHNKCEHGNLILCDISCSH